MTRNDRSAHSEMLDTAQRQEALETARRERAERLSQRQEAGGPESFRTLAWAVVSMAVLVGIGVWRWLE